MKLLPIPSKSQDSLCFIESKATEKSGVMGKNRKETPENTDMEDEKKVLLEIKTHT